MTHYRDQRTDRGRGHDSQWPHFDRRGPDHYYDEERYPERYFDRYPDDRRDPFRRYDDSDIYEDEFYREDDRYPRYQADDRRPRNYDQHGHWPEDRFYYHREQLRPPRENFFERGWHRLRDQWREFTGAPPSYGRYPEDHHHGPYGEEHRRHNANRGWGGRQRFIW